MKRIVLIALFAFATVAAVSATLLRLAAPASAQEPWGWELPDFGKPVHIVALYSSQEGHLVAWYSTLEVKRPRSGGLYDTTTRTQLATPDEMASIKDYATEQLVLAKHHLTNIPFQFLASNYQGARIELDVLSGRKCKFPYASAFSIDDLQGTAGIYLIVRKLPKADTRSDYGCSYVDTPQEQRLRTRYRAQRWNFYWTSGTDKYFVMEDVPWIVRFDAHGHTHFFDHRQDAGLVRAEGIQPLFGELENASQPRAQSLVNKIEAIIDAQLRSAR